MSIGLVGAHRVGKTTLAREVSRKCSIPFVETSTTKIVQSLGIDPGMPMDFDTRMKVQWAILKHYEEIYRACPTFFVTDRTPIDLLGYTYADIVGNTHADAAELGRYTLECFKLAAHHFQQFVVVQPGIPIVYAPGKAAINEAYIEHLNNLMIGFMYNPAQKVPRGVMAREAVELDRRSDAICQMLASIQKRAQEGKSNSPLH